MATVLAASDSGGGSFLVSPSLGLMIWTLLAFGITLYLLNKLAFPRIAEALDRRRVAIEESIESAERAKKEADDDLRTRGEVLDWTILRPGRLTDEPGTGLVRLGPSVPKDEVTRDDVAAVIAALLAEPASSRSAGRVLDLVGGETPIAEAVEGALRGQGVDAIASASEHAAEGTDPPGDLNATADYKRHLARVLTRRALEKAAAGG